MNRNFRKFILGVLLVVFLAPQVHAGSDDECAIWICLPAGFGPSECHSAYKAMVNRIKDFKPPLPDFFSCAVKSDDSSTMSYDYSYAAYVPAGKRCAEWFDAGEQTSTECLRYESWSDHYVKGTQCVNRKEEDPYPPGCTGTTRYIDVFIDGEQAGETYYWNRRR